MVTAIILGDTSAQRQTENEKKKTPKEETIYWQQNKYIISIWYAVCHNLCNK